MRISAQGYAKLTDKLCPTWPCWREGMPLKPLLPYVNMAIILALAGLAI